MDQIQQTTQKLLELSGFTDFKVDLDERNNKISIFINDGEWLKDWLPRIIMDLTHVLRLVAKKNNIENNLFVDINNYKKERERIIIDLAKAAARKVLMTKNEVRLPAMNAYERRLVHTELATRPDVTTISEGERADRCVVVRPLL